MLAGAGLLGVAGCAAPAPSAAPAPAPSVASVPHQPGVVTAPPAAAVFAAFDVVSGTPEAVFRALTPGTRATDAEVTIAVGASLFDGRFGLAKRAPRRLGAMPAFPNDVLDPALCHGDLLLQVASHDARTADAALRRALAPVGGALRPRWRIDGFREENTTTTDGRAATRDLFGFREGEGNPDVRDPAVAARFVWADDGEPAWAAGGTYQVVRRIRFSPALWDAEPTARQEAVIGRRKTDGAPLGHDREDAAFDYAADPSGQSIALDSHIRRANPRTPETEPNRILRRGYSFRTNPTPTTDRDEGIVFVCFQRDIEAGFATVQRRLAYQALDKYVLPVGGGYFFVLPGTTAAPDDHIGRTLTETP